MLGIQAAMEKNTKCVCLSADRINHTYKNSVIFQMCVNRTETKTMELKLGFEPMVF